MSTKKKQVKFNDDLPSEDEEFDGMNFGDRGDDAMDEDDYENDTEGVYKTLSDILDEQEEADHGRHWDLVDKIRGMGTGDSNKKRKLNDITQVRPENVWGVGGKVGMDDLLGTLDVDSEARKKLQKVIKQSDKTKISEAVAKPTKERIDRVVQYGETKERLSGWNQTVQSMRQAATLQFPLAEDVPGTARPSMTAITTKFAPATSLEMAIQDTLLQSGINEKKIKELETLQKRDLSEAEIAARTAQLAKMRSLFFFQEQKNKRLKKIKSKKYRKILRKAKERNQPTLAELEELDPEAAKEEHLKREKERAEERMTRKHKNTGKWAKYAASSQDPRFKEALKEHMSRGQDLLKKMNRINEDSDSEDLADEEARFRDEFLADASESGSGDEENEADGEEEDPNYPKTGVFAMKFMKRAHDKQKAEFDQLMQDMDEEDEEWQKRMEDAVANQKGTKAANFNLDDIEVDRSEDSDEEKEREIQARKAAKDAKKNADKAQEEANRTGTGRMKFTSASTKAHSVADASASPIKLTDAERRSSKKLSANSMRLEPGSEGYSVGLSGPINVGLEAASLGNLGFSHAEVDSDNFGHDGTTFNINQKSLSSATEKSPSISQKQSSASKKSAATQSKAQSKPQPNAQKRKEERADSDDYVDTDAIMLDVGAIAKGNAYDAGDDMEEDADPTPKSMKGKNRVSDDVISVKSPQTTKGKKKATESNPWMQQQEEDDEPVSKGKMAHKAAAKKAAATKKKNSNAESDEDNDSDEGNDERVALDMDHIRQTLSQGASNKGPIFNLVAASKASRSQRELINRAFAADHITEDDLASEKDLIAGEENEVDAEMAEMLMPGWGEWAGDGTRPSKRRVRLMQELKNKKEKRQDEILQGRKDAGLKHVVINEKRDKKFSKYQVADLPFPYKNKAAYEAAIRNPLGKEWNTQSAHKAIIRPKIQVKAGTIINPIQHKR